MVLRDTGVNGVSTCGRVFSFGPPLVLGIQATSPSCRCFPNEPCWPSLQQWSDFNATLGGKLISTVPIGSVCHTSRGIRRL
ncbi:FAD binding domain protein [Penicillium atrosanguineum]|nr:FAD binding domain protein [Penicillium atrosanguineum]